MSNLYKEAVDVPTDEIIKRLQELSRAVTDNRSEEFTMRIPVELDRDADVVLQEAAKRLRRASQREIEMNWIQESVRETIFELSMDGDCAYWTPCSGCHETNEGAETGNYSYSAAFGCYLGAGCSECGGLGAVWNHIPKAMLDDLVRNQSKAAI